MQPQEETTAIKQFELVDVEIDTIELDPTNPNVMSAQQMAAMRKSMQKYGYLAPIIIDRNNKICDGEHRFLVYKQLGITTIPAYKLDLDSDHDRRELRQIMNKLHGMHDRSKDSDELLMIMEQSQDNLKELSQLIAQPQEHLLELIKQYHPEVNIYQPEGDKEYPLVEAPDTELATLWQLGEHRLICGDCTDPKMINRVLLENEKVAQLNCDPPYGVRYGEKNTALNYLDKGNRMGTSLENDEPDTDYHSMFNDIFKLIPWADHNTIYIWSGEQKFHEIRLAMVDSELHFCNLLVWVKNQHVLGLPGKDYNLKHELCVYGWKGRHEFYGPFRTSLLEYDKPQRNAEHPTMKPIDLIQQTVTDGSKEGDIVLDVFAGSGSSLIASQRTGRIWRGIELDPRYCDVIIKRWEDFTGQKAEKVIPPA